MQFSNFAGNGPVRVGSLGGVGPYGTYDMAGNVKEWVWNQSGNRRYILGGGWNEPIVMFVDVDAQSPFDRLPTYGFRCIRNLGGSSSIPEKLTRPIGQLTRDYSKEIPASDQTFEIFKRFYAYDKTGLRPQVESVEDSEYWKKERITFNAAYGSERIVAHLFLPKNVAPPYQTIIFYPDGSGFVLRSSENVQMQFLDFIIKSGRAVLFPVYKGTYERRVELSGGPNVWRDLSIQATKDFFRSIDYLETRTDIDHDRLGYYGNSWGALVGPRLLALEPRVKVAVMMGGGLSAQREAPEIDLINFAPRVKVPVLMINGKYDFDVPLNTLQIPLFKLLGTPPKDKRLALSDTGHLLPRNEMIKETLDWMDRYLGPVNPNETPASGPGSRPGFGR